MFCKATPTRMSPVFISSGPPGIWNWFWKIGNNKNADIRMFEFCKLVCSILICLSSGYMRFILKQLVIKTIISESLKLEN